MQFRKAERQQAKLRVEFSGPSGSGKTFSALKCALGITSPDKIFMIDTEQGRGELYSHLGDYNYIRLENSFEPEKYIEAIRLAEANGAEVIIIDSASHEWEGPGGCLELHSKISGNSYVAWNLITPRHNRFLHSIMDSKAHVFTTVRRKQDYVLETNERGKQVPKKVGMKEVQRDGFEYEMTLSFDISQDHYATVSKTIDGLNLGENPFQISEETGKKMLEWASEGREWEAPKRESWEDEIATIDDLEALQAYYKANEGAGASFVQSIIKRKNEIENLTPLQ